MRTSRVDRSRVLGLWFVSGVERELGGGWCDEPDIWNMRYWFAIAVVSKSGKEILWSLSYLPTR